MKCLKMRASCCTLVRLHAFSLDVVLKAPCKLKCVLFVEHVFSNLSKTVFLASLPSMSSLLNFPLK